jgi:hypothetical protein
MARRQSNTNIASCTCPNDSHTQEGNHTMTSRTIQALIFTLLIVGFLGSSATFAQEKWTDPADRLAPQWWNFSQPNAEKKPEASHANVNVQPATPQVQPAVVPAHHDGSVSELVAQEPVRFRGAYVGQPLSELIDCSQKKPRALVDGYKVHGKVCDGERGVIARLKGHSRVMRGMLQSLSDSHSYIGTSFEGEEFFLDKSRVVRIRISFAEEGEWEKVKYDLTQKLGPPSSEVPQVYQNGFGARWEYDQGFWVKGDIVAYAGVKTSGVGSHVMTEGIQLNITDAATAKMPWTTQSTLD